jgi:hypothetical protein
MPHQASDLFWQNARSQQAIGASATVDAGAIRARVLVFVGYYLGAKIGPAPTFQPHPIATFSDALMVEAKTKGWIVNGMKDDWKTISRQTNLKEQ